MAISCGRMGRGGYARFPTFRLVLTDQRTDGRTDKASYRVACPQLKKKISMHLPTIIHACFVPVINDYEFLYLS